MQFPIMFLFYFSNLNYPWTCVWKHTENVTCSTSGYVWTSVFCMKMTGTSIKHMIISWSGIKRVWRYDLFVWLFVCLHLLHYENCSFDRYRTWLFVDLEAKSHLCIDFIGRIPHPYRVRHKKYTGLSSYCELSDLNFIFILFNRIEEALTWILSYHTLTLEK